MLDPRPVLAEVGTQQLWPRHMRDSALPDFSRCKNNPLLADDYEFHSTVQKLRMVRPSIGSSVKTHGCFHTPQDALKLQTVNVLLGPSGVGKTTMLRAVAEGQWAVYTELPDWRSGSTKLLSDSSSEFKQRLSQSAISREAAQSLVCALLLAKLLVLLMLHTAGRVTEPAHWMQAQLSGYDQMILRTSVFPPTSSGIVISHATAGAGLFMSLAECEQRRLLAWLGPVLLALQETVTVGKPMICMVDEAQQVFQGYPEWPFALDNNTGIRPPPALQSIYSSPCS